jgi:hypothetical protein
MLRAITVGLACVLAAAPALSQAPDAAWRTLRTPHFRVHYTAPAEAWSRRAAARFEAIRERVIEEVGYAPPQVVDVVVANPVAQPNGMALPILGTPRMVLWTSPPGPASSLGEFTDWSELLVVHEETHLAHLLRPSRNPMQRLLEALLPVGPIALRAPRWVDEGYATLLEGKLTGSGRPNGDMRAAILRQRARAGKLPTYAQMAHDSQSWLGMSMAYLAGSAYLEWLEQRGGPDSLRHLWARLSARKDRSFAAAFEGVFGDSPEKLYDRFTAELTWRAMEVERRLDPVRCEGDLWQELTWTTGAPALSRDGTLMAIVLRDRNKPSRIVIWSTGPNREAERRWKEAAATLLRRDAADVAPVRSKPLAREPLHVLVTANGAEPFSVRFMPDGRSVLFVRFEPDGDGFLHPDLFRWAFETGKVSRVTHLADVRDADPSPDGSWAVAVRDRNGFSQLVRVDLATGAVSEITAPSLDLVYAWPRVSPDASRLAFDRHEQGRWTLVLRDLGTGRERTLPTPAGANVAAPAWSADGNTVFVSLGRDGLVNVVRLDVDGGEPVPVTQAAGAALSPVAAPDGSGVYFLSLQADGLSLRHLVFAGCPPRAETLHLPAALAPAVRPPAPTPPPPLAAGQVAPGRDYGFGRQEMTPLVGGAAAPSARVLELGVRVGDVVGRLDTVAVGALADSAGPRGGLLGVGWRGWPVAVSLTAFSVKEEPSRQSRTIAGLGRALDAERQGAALGLGWRRHWRATTLGLRGDVAAWRLAFPSGGDVTERLAGASLRVVRESSRGSWRFPQLVEARAAAGRTGDASWRRYGAGLSVGVTRRGTGIELAWRRDSVRDAKYDVDRLQLGGVATSVFAPEAWGNRIVVPALPVGTRIGDDHEEQKATLMLDGLPLFFVRHRVWAQGSPRGEWLRLAGIELDLTSDPLPIVRLPGVHLTVGAARVLDAPLKDATQAWLAVAWRP